MLPRVALVVSAALLASGLAQNVDSPPNYNVYNPPETSFTCEGKVVGGYYADPDAACQLFHICVQIDETQVQDFRFLCPNDTLFDQENFVCANWRDVDCARATQYYSKNLDLFKPSEEEVEHVHWDERSKTAVNQRRRRRQLFEAPLAPTDELANSSFTCDGLSPGGYYADVDSGCVVFHVCKPSGEGFAVDQKYRCLNGTLFDQKKLICRPQDIVDCSQTMRYYNSSVEHHLSSIVLQIEFSKHESTSTSTGRTFDDAEEDAPCCPPTTETSAGTDESGAYDPTEESVFKGFNITFEDTEQEDSSLEFFESVKNLPEENGR